MASAILSLLPGSRAQAAPAAKKPVKSAGKGSRKPPVHGISLPDEPPPQWRNYELRTTVNLEETDAWMRLWLPLVQYRDTPWERSFGHHWRGNYTMAGIYRDPVADMEVFYADWLGNVDDPKLEIVSKFATQDRRFDITRRVIAERTEILRRCLQATQLVPIDGIVRLTAERAIGRVKDPLAQAKAIYDWVVANAAYDPQAYTARRSVASLLENGRPAGQSIEISLLFVGLCRAIGIPARPVFGLRMDRSRLFASLGASGELNSSQHCRAEFYSPGYGWVPVNPSDVCKAIRNETLNSSDPKGSVLKKRLFGFWEMNWVGFNTAQDVLLQGSSQGVLPFLTKPVLETHKGRFDAPDSEHFSYNISAEELKA
jgi:transglutaminase-like putative cysteine protease